MAEGGDFGHCQSFMFINIILYLAPMRVNSSRPTLPNNQPNQPEQQQAEQQNQANKAEPQKKQSKKRQFALKPQNFQTAKGLKKLYDLTNQIKWEDPMPTESAMNLVVVTLKTWQREMMPKYSYSYFLQRCQALGSHKLVAAYLHKVRRIHKGLDRWDQPIQQNKNPNQQPTNKTPQNSLDNEGLDLANPYLNNQQNYEDEINELQKFKQRAELAKKLAHTSLTPAPNHSHPKTERELIDEMMDEDLRMFQEMSRRKNDVGGKGVGVGVGGEDGDYDDEGNDGVGVDLGDQGFDGEDFYDD